jgi:hypothetical protein
LKKKKKWHSVGVWNVMCGGLRGKENSSGTEQWQNEDRVIGQLPSMLSCLEPWDSHYFITWHDILPQDCFAENPGKPKQDGLQSEFRKTDMIGSSKSQTPIKYKSRAPFIFLLSFPPNSRPLFLFTAYSKSHSLYLYTHLPSLPALHLHCSLSSLEHHYSSLTLANGWMGICKR